MRVREVRAWARGECLELSRQALVAGGQED